MQWLQRLNIISSTRSVRTRLILAFAVLLSLLLLVSFIAIERFSLLTTSMQELVNTEAQNSRQAQNLYQYSQASAIDLLRLLQTSERSQRIPLYHTMDQSIAAAGQALAALQKSDIDAALLEPLVTVRAEYKDAFYVTVEVLELQGLAEAQIHYDVQTAPLLKDLLEQTMSLDSFQHQAVKNKVNNLQETVNQALLSIVLIGLVALLAGFLLAYLLGHSISNPLNKAVKIASAVANGDYSGLLPHSRIKEFQQLFSALSTMRSSILIREQRISRLAYTDALTGLANRTRFMEAFEQAIAAGSGTLAVLDLNRFGQINQALGHNLGDQLLQQVAERLNESLPDTLCTARLDSDKFALLLSVDANTVGIKEQVQQLLRGLQEPVELDSQRLDIDARIGLVHFPQDGTSLTDLLKQADLAIDAAKQRHLPLAYGADCSQAQPHEQLSLLGEMREALSKKQLYLAYQPKVNSQTGEVFGVEALIRWQHPDKGNISPSLFIPFAEQTGFIRELTPWVIEQALKDCNAWQQQGLRLVVSINISTLDLAGAELIPLVHNALDVAAIEPRYLCLEITESALIDDPQQALTYLQQLASLGVKLSIDDYGTGQASLAYVKDLPVNELKIDRVFVTQVDQQPRQAAIVGSTILMCQQLGLSVVAEGVETESEVQWLQQRGCDLLQGFGIARPMPAPELIQWIHDRPKNSPSLKAVKPSFPQQLN